MRRYVICTFSLCFLCLQLNHLVAFQESMESETTASEAVPSENNDGDEVTDDAPLNVVDTVIAALEAEANGDLEAREKLLATAMEKRNSTPAMWHAGQVYHNANDLKSIEDSVALASKNKTLKKYRERRTLRPESVDSHLDTASWCINQGLNIQARAHLERVLDIEPDHFAARQFLGYARVGNDWISPQELNKIDERAALKQQSIRLHGKKLSKLIGRLNSRRQKVRDLAAADLLELKDVDAVGAVESALASNLPAPSMLAMDWMEQIDTVDATRVIARYSLLHPNESVREYAIEKLAKRPLFDFVPEMLDLLSSPVSMTIVPNFDNRGALTGYRQAFAREGFEGKEFVTIDRGFERQTPALVSSGGQRVAGSTNAMTRSIEQQLEQRAETMVRQQADEEIRNRNQIMEQQNEQIAARNRQIGNVISEVSGLPKSIDPKDMWQWWDQYNETQYQDYKPERYQRETISTSTPRLFSSTPVGNGRGITRRAGECFVAGTPVMTCFGLSKIEDIVTGDLVLSRNISTGELSWNPVLRPTTRPPSATVNISIDDESLVCSSGHLFWVSGQGWRKASELKEGDVLHGAEKPSIVTSAVGGDSIETHNLEVADNANYFVGKNMIMAHDVTPRQTNRQKVPGQDLLQYLKK